MNLTGDKSTRTRNAWFCLAVALIILSGCEPAASPTGNTESGSTNVGASPSTDQSTSPSAENTPEVVSGDGSQNAEEDFESPVIVTADSTKAPTRQSDGPSNGDEETLTIAFEDVQILMQENMVFRPVMLTDRVRELEGKRIRINGYMNPDIKTKGIDEFVLLKNTECKFGLDGRADHLMIVIMQNGLTTKFHNKPISVEGIFTLNPFQGPDGNTWSIYDLKCDHVEIYRPER